MSEVDLERGLNRLDLNIKLIQTFIGEQLYKSRQHGTRKTFSFLQSTLKSKSLVFKLELTMKQVFEMQPNEIYLHLANEIKKDVIYDVNSKYLAFLSFTNYKENASPSEIKNGENKVGYCALGIKL
jgi:hypothetical protein